MSKIVTLLCSGDVASLSETELAEGDEISHPPKKKQSFRNADRGHRRIDFSNAERHEVASRNLG